MAVVVVVEHFVVDLGYFFELVHLDLVLD